MARKRQAKPGQLIAWYGSLERGENPDFCIAYGGEGADRSDGRILCHAICNAKLWDTDVTLLQELEKRGYDLNTLKFSIQQKSR